MNKTKYVFLPSIENETLFLLKLNSQLESLSSKSLDSKLDFCLFLHTNDSSKELEYLLSPDSGIENPNPNDLKLLLAYSILWKTFQFRGYDMCYSVDFKGDSIDKICKRVYHALSSHVVSVNEATDNDGFIELKKSTLLKIISAA